MLPFSEACERNKDPILRVLLAEFADRSNVLEIGSGTGQHAVYFAARLRHLTWQPTERAGFIEDLAARIEAEGGVNLRHPSILDVRQTVWPASGVDAIFTANTLHIMSWPDVTAMFRGFDSALAPNGVVCIYGPFRYEGRYTSPSNLEFDRFLQARDPSSGLRDIREVADRAADAGLKLTADHDLPANNRLLVLKKDPAYRGGTRER